MKTTHIKIYLFQNATKSHWAFEHWSWSKGKELGKCLKWKNKQKEQKNEILQRNQNWKLTQGTKIEDLHQLWLKQIITSQDLNGL